MRLKSIVAEDFCNYKVPSLFLVSSVCDWKCCTEQCLDIGVCQNAPLISQPTHEIDNKDIYNIYCHNDITKAVIIGGLEPFLQFEEMVDLISYFRFHGEDCDFVIYTGYYPEEIKDKITILSSYKNIVVKFGRFIPNQKQRYDDVLGITLISDNQFATRIS